MILKIPDYSDEQLRRMPPVDRHELWKKARSLGVTVSKALELAEKIEALGLPYSDPKCLKLDDPITIKMYELVFSPEGKKAGLDATSAGLPALAGIDPILTRELGVDYGAHNMSTMTAGAFVAEMMRTFGFEKTGKSGKLPTGCRAKTAVFFAPRVKTSAP